MRTLRLVTSLLPVAVLAACGGDAFEAASGGAGQGGTSSAGQAGSSAGGAGASSGTAGASGTAAGQAGTGQSGAGQAGAGQAGAGQAGTGQAGSSGKAGGGQSGGGQAGAPVAAVYVSPTGSDSNDGLLPTTPKATVQEGIAAATTAMRSNVRVCVGKYVLSSPVSVPAGLTLTGGVDCKDFVDPPAPPTKDELCAGSPVPPEKLTTLEAVDTAVSVTTGGPAVTLVGLDLIASHKTLVVEKNPVVIDRCRIVVRQDSPKTETAAVLATEWSGTLKNSCVRGGGGVADVLGRQVASSGIYLAGGAGIVTGSVVHGGLGLGSTNGFGSIAIVLAGAPAKVKDSDIHGGSGSSSMTARAGSVGLYAFNLSSAVVSPTFDGNTIDGGSGTHTSNEAGSEGVVVSSSVALTMKPSITNNTIDGGTGKNSGVKDPASFGIAAFQSDVQITGNLVKAGSSADTPQAGAAAIGLLASTGNIRKNALLGPVGAYLSGTVVGLNGSSGVRIENNMIHTGSLKAQGAYVTFGILADPASADLGVLDNTIVLSDGQYPSSPFVFSDKPKNPVVRFEGNLIVGSTLAQGPILGGCPQDVFTSFAANTFSGLPGELFTAYSTGSFTGCAVLAVDGVEPAQPAFVTLCTGRPCAGKVVDNVQIRESCAAPACVQISGCGNQAGCGDKLFATWTAPDGGIGSLTGNAGGWKLRANAPCAAVSTTWDAGAQQDKYGTMRATPFSRGAHEATGCSN